MAADVRQHQLVEAVFACQGEQGSAHSDTQQQEEPREVTNPHLEGLRGRRQQSQLEQPLIGPPDRTSRQEVLTSVTAKTLFPQGTTLYHLSCRRSMKPSDLYLLMNSDRLEVRGEFWGSPMP